MNDTIFAEATAPGRAGVSIIRLSGPDAWAGAEALAGTLPEPRKTGLRNLVDSNGNILDQAVAVCFEKGHSFTGERSVELHVHGSRAVVAAVLSALSQVAGLRPAKAGEFTRRALENGNLDLTQVEGLADLIAAETESQRVQAVNVMQGALSTLCANWRRDLTRSAALLEVTMDFADEEVPTDVTDSVLALLDRIGGDLAQEVAGADISERIRDGFEVAIIGRPNVGKSTLLNCLAGREAAITSDVAGTTRDVIEVHMNLGGLPVTLLDTAGLRASDDAIEAMGVSLAVKRASNADLRLFLIDDGDQPADLNVAMIDDDIVVTTKADVKESNNEFAVSGRTGQGVDALTAAIAKVLQGRAAKAGSATRQRHVVAMRAAIGALDSARLQLQASIDSTELAAEEIRSAIRHLDELIGRVGVENILDVVFMDFCIGK